MQFSCESCKAQLQIADEKIRGKRLIVRCRRCGAKIALADPALANSSPRLIERSSPPGPMRVSPHPAPARQPIEDESTRAMDSEMLERALQASKAEEEPHNGAPATQKLHFPRPAVPPDEVEWFAMIRGKQTGPLARDELLARANDGEVGPRTYLWRDGMDAWQRAVDVPDLYEMFPQLPPPASRPPPAPTAAAAAPAAASPQPAPSRSAIVPTTSEPAPAEEPQQEKAAEPTPPAVHRITPPTVHRSFPSFGSGTPLERGPFTVFFGLMALAAAAIVLWIALAPGSKDQPSGDPQAAGSPAAPPSTRAPEPRPAESQPAAGEAPLAAGLTAEQVHRKLDENKPALQGCVDEALRRDPGLKVGKIHVATTIAPSGAVTAARIDQPSVDESPLGACLKQATRKIVFPRFAGGAFDVDIPIVVTAESR